MTQLTPTEEKVSALVADALLNREIAVRLGMAEKTVKNHVYAAFRKLGARNRVELALKVRGLM